MEIRTIAYSEWHGEIALSLSWVGQFGKPKQLPEGLKNLYPMTDPWDWYIYLHLSLKKSPKCS